MAWQRWWTGVGLSITLVFLSLAPLGVAAHTGPSRVVRVQAGATPLVVSIYATPARVGNFVPITVERADGAPLDPSQVTVQAVPDVASVASLTPPTERDPDNNVAAVANFTFVTAGDYLLNFTLHSGMDEAGASLPLPVEPAPQVPYWIGWAAALVPIAFGLTVFGVMQRRTLRLGQRAVIGSPR